MTQTPFASNEELLEIVPRPGDEGRRLGGLHCTIRPGQVTGLRKLDRDRAADGATWLATVRGFVDALRHSDCNVELSELELVDVCGGDDLDWPENHLTLGADRCIRQGDLP
jgi:hypothetical protein